MDEPAPLQMDMASPAAALYSRAGDDKAELLHSAFLLALFPRRNRR